MRRKNKGALAVVEGDVFVVKTSCSLIQNNKKTSFRLSRQHALGKE